MVYWINFELAKTVEWFGGQSRFSESTFLEARTCKQATNHPDRNGALRNRMKNRDVTRPQGTQIIIAPDSASDSALFKTKRKKKKQKKEEKTQRKSKFIDFESRARQNQKRAAELKEVYSARHSQMQLQFYVPKSFF